MIKLYSLLKRGRLRKKGHIYKRLLLMSFDVTIAFYVLLMIGYIVFAFSRSGNVFTTVQQFVIELEAISLDYFWVLLTVIPLGMLLRTFSQPGIVISTAEYTVMALPHTPWKIWWMAALERWVKFAIFLVFLGSGLWLFSPTSGPVILLYVSLLLVLNMIMTVIEWRVFQLNLMWKIVIFLGGIGINIVSMSTSPPIVAGITSVGLIVVSTFLLPHVVRHINWKKVTAACDYKIWNMFLVSYMTKQKMKKERSYTFWQRLPFWRRPLPYKKHALYHRLWHVYFQRQIVMLMQFIGAIFVLVGFVPITNRWLVEWGAIFGFSITSLPSWVFYVSLSLGIHMYASFVAAIWKDRLTADIVQVVPWDVWLFQRTLLRWALGASVLFLFPIGLFAYDNGSIVYLLQMILAGCAFVFLAYWKIVDMMRTVSEEDVVAIPNKITLLGYGLLVLMIASVFFPYVLLIAFILLCLVGLAHHRHSSIR